MNKETEIKYNKGLNMYLNGISTIKISKELKISRSRFSNYLKEQGIKVDKLPHKKKINENIFEIIDTEEKAYWLGFIVADGNIGIYNNNKTFQIMLQSQDKYILEKLRTSLGCNIRRYDKERDAIIITQSNLKYNKKKDEYSLSVCSSKIYDDLYSHGIYPRKTFNTTIPTGIPDDLFRHFVRGLFDGDGCITTNTGYDTKRIIFYGQNSLLEPLQNKLKQDIPTLNDVKIFHKKTLSMLTYGSKKDVNSFYHYLYNDATIYLTRKKKNFL